MIFAIECIIFCFIMWLLCFLGTGSDEKNLKSFKSYGNKLQNLLKEDEDYKDKIKPSNLIMTFISNLVLFTIIIFIFGIFIRSKEKDYLYNFLALLILGQIVNAFDFFIIDCIWFTNVKRVRFTKYPDKALYKNVLNHFYAFIRGAIMFVASAAIAASILILF